MVDKLNDQKNRSDTFVIMQMYPEKVLPEPLPTQIPAYPVPDLVAATVIDRFTKLPVPTEKQNA